MFEGECTNVVMDSDGSIGRPGMALASHSPSPPKKKKKKNYRPMALPQKILYFGPSLSNFLDPSLVMHIHAREKLLSIYV
jgi:hypothetical protein